ncbi:hypothetical protein [Clostridium botulinum]|uniref:hypothetical protein n=1 Tax=Clostridium botulinum TaxID=1491 RepID=UPI0013FAE2FB|nr:hypothetical protein [Clostridium botulinum]MBY6948393.1 hypothetical protein [Clostridium botulinum]MBY7021394.1 hypothetical protein [Clostridium botulinum]NFI30659.1 hypothetical protein [Clostridium botulinum]
MDKKEIEDLMEQRGFTLWATLGNKKLQFLSNNDNTDLVINCIINPETEEFEFKYLVSKSVMQLVNPKCSPFTNKKHFEGMLNKFMRAVEELQYLNF